MRLVLLLTAIALPATGAAQVREVALQALESRGVSYPPYLYAAGVIDRAWPSQRLQTVPLFRFRSGFWNNLHHFLYVLGRDRNGTPDRARAAVVNAPKDLEGLSARSDAERALWSEAIGFYAAGPSKKDAVFDKDLSDVTGILARARDDSDLAGLGLDPALVDTLRKAAPVYRAVWWARHSARNEERRKDFQAAVDTHGRQAVTRLTALYGTTWPAVPRVIDIAAYSNWAGAYSVTGGVIVMASMPADLGGAIGLEILLHESSHQWDDEIDRRLAAIAAKQGRTVPGDLSHALIWYTTGAVVSEIVPGHVPYAARFGLWNLRGLAALKPALDQHWLPYLQGKATFDEAIANVLAGGL